MESNMKHSYCKPFFSQVCVCWGFRPTREFFTHHRCRDGNLDLYLALSSEGFLACHTYCDTGRQLRGPVTLTPTAESLAFDDK